MSPQRSLVPQTTNLIYRDKAVANHGKKSEFTDNLIKDDHEETRFSDNCKGIKAAQNLNIPPSTYLGSGLPTNTTVFTRSLWLCEKADLCKGYVNPKRKL